MKKKNCSQKKRRRKNAIVLVFYIRRTGFDQSSPVQPVSESRGGPLSVTYTAGVVVAGQYFSFLI